MRTMVIFAAILAGGALNIPAHADRKVFLDAAFETGQIQPSSGRVDPFWVMTLPDPQPAGASSFVSPQGDGGFDANSKTDFRVVWSEVWKGESISPRAGAYFVRNVIDRNKSYPNGKPRSHFNLTTPAQEYYWDEEVWIGFSVYIPSSWEHDNRFKRQDNAHLSGIGLFASNATADSTHLALRIHPASDSDFNEWSLRLIPVDPTSTKDARDAYHSLGSVVPDLGKWTDFVFRIRWNPFSKRTNPALEGIAGARDQWYEGNRGILQIWKSAGEVRSDGNRQMELVFSRENEPLGLVPRADRGLNLIFDMYKYGWQEFDTDPKGPIFIGFDEIRYGRTPREGTGFADVAPSGKPLAPLALPQAPITVVQ